MLEILFTNGFAIIGAIATTRWALRRLDACEARLRRALSDQPKAEGGGDEGV